MKINRLFPFFVVTIMAFICFAFLSAKKKIAPVKMKWLDSVLKIQNDTTYVINFWATWCIPCVAELPEFEKIHKKYIDHKVNVILVSLDYVKKLDETVIPFAEKKKISSNIVLFNEPNANAWIDKVDSTWSGALPATLIVNKNTSFRTFLEKELNFETLDSIIEISLSK